MAELPTEVRVIDSWEDLDRALLAMRVADARIAQEGARYDQVIQAAQEKKSKALSPIQARKERMEVAIKEFAVNHRGDLKGKKSIDLVHGRVGWRKGHLQLIPSDSEANTIRLLKIRGHVECVVMKEELDKAALKNLPVHERGLCGIKEKQEERFYFDLSTDPPIVYPDSQPEAENGTQNQG